MKDRYPLKIDAFAHIAPPKYRDLLRKAAPKLCAQMIDTFPPLFDMDHRFRIMDKYELVQVIAPSWPAIELAAPTESVDLARALPQRQLPDRCRRIARPSFDKVPPEC